MLSWYDEIISGECYSHEGGLENSRRWNLSPELEALVEIWEEEAILDFNGISIFDTIAIFSSKKTQKSSLKVRKHFKIL